MPMELGERFVNATRYPRSMKTLKFIAPIATFWSVLIAGVLLADSASAKSLSAQVQSVSGTASYQLPGEQSTPITPGTQIPEGAVITTGAGASIDVFLGRNTGVVRLTQNSILRIEKLQSSDTGGDRVTETALQLQEGELFGNVNKQAAGSTYVITLPDGNLEVAKSRFQVTYQAVQALQDGAKNGQVGDTTPHSIVRLIAGHVAFAHEGTTTPITGSGEFVSGSASVVPLSPEAAKAIAQVIPPVTPPSEPSNPTVSSPRALAVVTPQDIPLSPTTGSAN